MALAAAICIKDSRANQPAAAAAYEGVLYVVDDEGNQLERCNGATWDVLATGGLGTGALAILTADPASPANGTGWFLYTAGTGALELRLRIAGATKSLDIGTVV